MPAPYYLVIPDGPRKTGPVKSHGTIEAAQREARRLQASLGGLFYVRILETHSDLEKTHVPVSIKTLVKVKKQRLLVREPGGLKCHLDRLPAMETDSA